MPTNDAISAESPRPFTSIRARTGIIFFAGLLLLILGTLFVSVIVSGAIEQDAVLIDRLTGLSNQVAEWDLAATAGDDLPAEEPPVAATIRPFLDGGPLLVMGRAPRNLTPVSDEKLAGLLDRVLAAWPAFQQAAALTRREPGNALARDRLSETSRDLRQTLDDATLAARLHHADNRGMVRGLFAALFLASLVFLLIGLWFMQQIVVAPVEALDRVAQRIAGGDLDTPVVLGGYGEFYGLAQSFETMRLELRRSRERLTRWTSDLEAHGAQLTQQLSALSQVIAAASRSLELDTVLRTGLEQSLEAVGLEMGGVWLMDEVSGRLRLAAEAGLSDPMREIVHQLEVGQGVIGRAGQSGQTIALDDIAQTPTIVLPIAIQQGLRGLVAVPIKLREHVLGVLAITTRRTRPFTPAEIALLTSIGQQIGIAVDSLRLAEEVRQRAQQVAALEERERIGIELHDGLLQTLGYLYLKIDQLETQAEARGLGSLAAELALYRDVLERASTEARRFIADLREPLPLPMSLQAALGEMVAEFSASQNMVVTLQADGPPLLLDATQIAHLVRIAREALINAVQHGQAQHASVTCERRGCDGELSIQDDGAGFDVSGVLRDGRDHFGLTVMQARAARIGGSLLVDSAPGHGVRVRVVWPVER